ncbi:MAG: hypothetical protein OXI22_14065 [Defluviicoccus sp.]|nr:hypothetical protein [Defluviicoccus sp.]MDE0385009.1 hypothetical protein [Defluviicoccus sp.]
MNNVGNWVIGGSSAVLGVAGLFVSAQADPGSVGYYGGLAMFAICILFIMHLIRTSDSHG